MPAIDQLPASLLGAYRFISVIYAPPIEDLQGTPTVLATTAATPQISYTLTSDMFPFLDPPTALLNTPKYHAHLYAAGHSPTSGRTVSYAGYKNGTPTLAFDTVPGAGDDWTALGIFTDVAVGDLLEVALTSRGAGAEWDYTALFVFIDTMQVADDTHLLGRANCSLSYQPFLSLGTPTVTAIGPYHAEHEGLIDARLGVGAVLDALIMAAPDYAGRIHFGNEDVASRGYTGASRPMYVQNIVPFGFLFWETEITVGTIDALPDDLQGVQKTYTITYPAPAEALDGSPPDLPTSLPGSPQFSVTVGSGDLPTIAPAPIGTPKYHALIYLGGDSVSSGYSVTFEVRKNGDLIGSDTGGGTTHWTANAFIPDVSVGDVLEVFAYASAASVTWDYQAYAVVIDEVQLAPPDRLLANVEYTMIAYPVLASGTPTVEDTGAFRIQHLGLMEVEIDTDTSLTCQVQRSSMYSGWAHYGHLAHASIVYPRTSHPAYLQNAVPTEINFILTDITL